MKTALIPCYAPRTNVLFAFAYDQTLIDRLGKIRAASERMLDETEGDGFFFAYPVWRCPFDFCLYTPSQVDPKFRVNAASTQVIAADFPLPSNPLAQGAENTAFISVLSGDYYSLSFSQPSTAYHSYAFALEMLQALAEEAVGEIPALAETL
jgi:hypothetical protein